MLGEVKIKEALDNSCCVLVFWSFTSVDFKIHHWVRAEAEFGRRKGRLVPLLLDNVETPIEFSHIQAADLSDWNNKSTHTAFQQLVNAIKRKISPQSSSKIVQLGGSATLKIGDEYGGGIVFFIDDTGKHGLIAAKADLPGGDKYSWEAAKKACKDLDENGYSDWYLPNKDELNKLYEAKSAVGGFADNIYWSSTEIDASNAWVQNFRDGNQYINNKGYKWRVRPVRRF